MENTTIKKYHKSDKKLFKHQEDFQSRNKNRDLLVWEGGLGKSLAGCIWINQRSELKTLVVCPKSIKGKWERTLKEEGVINTDVCTRDEVKKINLNNYGALVLDEAQDFASPIFDKGRSQRTTALYQYVKSHPKAHILLLTATPIRSSPWNIHTLACYLGIYWDVKKFRDEFFHLTDKFGRLHYEKNKDWRIKIRPYTESIADIILMKECVDVPVQHNQIIKIPWATKQEAKLQSEYLEPSAEWHLRHRLENGQEKFAQLQEIISRYRKIVVVCLYTEQLEQYSKAIG